MHTLYQDEKDLDDMLAVRHLSPRAPGETLRQAVDRLINWEVMANLDPAVSSAAQVLVDKGRDAALLSVIQRLNQNPYSLTKSECVHVLQMLLAESPDGHLAQDLDAGLFRALSNDPNAKQHVRDAAEEIEAEHNSASDLAQRMQALADEPTHQRYADVLRKTCGIIAGHLRRLGAMENKPVQVWCDTCDGSGIVHQEGQRGVVGSSGDHPCPDCDGNGFNVIQYAKAAA